MNNYEDKTDDRKKTDEAAFPGFIDGPEWEGMNLRTYAAIELRIPDSGIDWLDKMIAKAERRDITVKTTTALISGSMLRFKEPSYSDNDMAIEALDWAEYIYTIVKERDKEE